jgi:hypothetical protein
VGTSHKATNGPFQGQLSQGNGPCSQHQLRPITANTSTRRSEYKEAAWDREVILLAHTTLA